MAAIDLSFWDYVKEAFFRRVTVPALGPLPLNLMGVALALVLGLANPGFWFLGLAAELGYLVSLAGSSRFQTLVRGERLLGVQRGWDEKVHRTVARLQGPSRERYRRLLGQCRRILGISESLDSDSLGTLRDLRSHSLNQLLSIFLRLLASREVIVDNVEGLDRKHLEHDLEQLETRLEAVDGDADPALRRSLEGTLAIQKKRLDNHDRAGASLKVIDAELERIEQQVELLREEAAVTGGPESLSARLDAVTTAMGETSRWMDQHADLFGSLAADDTAGQLTDLPRLPEAVEKE